MFTRILKKTIAEKFFNGKAIIITGPRQTGKTTLAKDLLKDVATEPAVVFNCDNPTDRDYLDGKDLEFLQKLVGRARVVFIDEGQKVASIGQTLKLLVDHFGKSVQLLVTGSSSINLLDGTQETLAGRKFTATLFPLSLLEIHPDKNPLLVAKSLRDLLIYGAYPEVVSATAYQDRVDILRDLASGALYKDILGFQQVRNSMVISGLLKALALQIGSEVSCTELAGLLGIDKKTVERYVDLLEKCFIVFRLPPFCGNKRREISKLKKIYFYDLGIRNMLINNFNSLDSRNDVGALWENFLAVERLKRLEYERIHCGFYFWRTYDGSEIDWVEEAGGRLAGYEFKWKAASRARMPPKWGAYPGSSFAVIDPSKLEGFIL
ncbi:MAG: ATP-binding protein [Elusimicrobia bacterium]|nr:ATP-binding protein [Elusimicrobiota bacterium]